MLSPTPLFGGSTVHVPYTCYSVTLHVLVNEPIEQLPRYWEDIKNFDEGGGGAIFSSFQLLLTSH